MTEEPRIKVKVTKEYAWEDCTGDFDSVISHIQDLKDEWVGIEAYTDGGYDMYSLLIRLFVFTSSVRKMTRSIKIE